MFSEFLPTVKTHTDVPAQHIDRRANGERRQDDAGHGPCIQGTHTRLYRAYRALRRWQTLRDELEETREPIVQRFDVSASPVLTYTLRGPGSLSALREYADDVLRPALEQVPGVAAVDIKGGAKREVRVELELDGAGSTAASERGGPGASAPLRRAGRMSPAST